MVRRSHCHCHLFHVFMPCIWIIMMKRKKICSLTWNVWICLIFSCFISNPFFSAFVDWTFCDWISPFGPHEATTRMNIIIHDCEFIPCIVTVKRKANSLWTIPVVWNDRDYSIIQEYGCNKSFIPCNCKNMTFFLLSYGQLTKRCLTLCRIGHISYLSSECPLNDSRKLVLRAFL